MLTLSGAQHSTNLLCRFLISGFADVAVYCPVFPLTLHRAVRSVLAAFAPKFTCGINTGPYGRLTKDILKQ